MNQLNNNPFYKMNMERVIEFLKIYKDVAFATVEDNKPKLRVFQIMKIIGNELYFATAARKEVYRQLQSNPFVELLAMHENISVRVAGKVMFDVNDDICKAIYNENAILQRLYADYTSMVYFRLPMDYIDYYDLSPNPPLLLHFPETQK